MSYICMFILPSKFHKAFGDIYVVGKTNIDWAKVKAIKYRWGIWNVVVCLALLVVIEMEGQTDGQPDGRPDGDGNNSTMVFQW